MTKEEAISRKAVIEIIDDCNSDGLKGIFCSYDDGEKFKEYIKNLPPFTPQEPKTEQALDKIKAEIEQIEINGNIRDVCFSAGINTALNIINKYRAESGKKE